MKREHSRRASVGTRALAALHVAAAAALCLRRPSVFEMSADDLHDLPPGVASTPALPAGWSTGWSAEYGRAYYCNAQLGKTQWEPPTADPLPPPPPTASTAPTRCWPDAQYGGKR